MIDPTDPLDVLYLECIPHRITPPHPLACADGPTIGWLVLQRQREAWAAQLALAAVVKEAS